MAAIPYVALLVCLAGTLAALISILAFFLGTADEVIFPFIWLQIFFAILILPTIPMATRAWRRYGAPGTPAWIIVTLIVVFCLMLLGELSVLIAWVKVHEKTTYLYHLPSVCVAIYCVGFWANSMRLLSRPAANPFQGR